MAGIPLWLLGRNITVAISNLNLLTDGTFSVSSSGTLQGRLDSVQTSFKPTLENISPMDSLNANYVKTEQENTWTLNEILQEYNGDITSINVLRQVADNYDYVKVVLANAGKTYTFYGIVGDYNETYNKGKSTCSLVIHQVTLTSGTTLATPPSYGANPSIYPPS